MIKYQQDFNDAKQVFSRGIGHLKYLDHLEKSTEEHEDCPICMETPTDKVCIATKRSLLRPFLYCYTKVDFFKTKSYSSM